MTMLYFLPGCDSADPDLAAYGLRHAFEGPPTLVTGQRLDGVDGALAAQRCDASLLALRPDLQTWRSAPGGRYRFGWWNGEPPTPESLLRSDAYGGVPVTMADGREWLAPQLRLYESALGFTVALPTMATLNDEGEWSQGTVLPEYQRLDRAADRLLEGMIAAEDKSLPAAERPPRMTVTESLDLACELLGANYRLSRVELSEKGLGVLDTGAVLRRVLRAACDMDACDEDIKKKLKAQEKPRASAG